MLGAGGLYAAALLQAQGSSALVLVLRRKILAVTAGQGVDGHLIFPVDGGDGAAGPAVVYQVCIFSHECKVFEICFAIRWSLISDDRGRRNMAMKVVPGLSSGGSRPII